MKPDLVVFDMAGTTVHDNDNVHYALMEAMMTEHIEVSRDEVNEVMGYPKPFAIKELLKLKVADKSLITTAFIDRIHDRFVNMMVDFYTTDPVVKEKPGASDIFIKLKECGILVGIDTGFDRAIANAIIQRLGWEQNNLIDASITSDEVKNGRPHADMILALMKKLNIKDARKVAKVGDTASDMKQGDLAGCGWIIGVTTGAFTRDELEREFHTHMIDQLKELEDIFSLRLTPTNM